MLHDNPHHERHRHTHTRTSPCSQAAEHKMEKEKTCGESVVSFLLRARERDGSSLRNRRRAQHAAAALLHHCAKMQVLPRGTHAADVEVTRQSSKRCKQSTNFGAAAERGSVEAATERKYILGLCAPSPPAHCYTISTSRPTCVQASIRRAKGERKATQRWQQMHGREKSKERKRFKLLFLPRVLP